MDISKFQRQGLLLAVAVVNAEHLVQILFISRKVDAGRSPLTINGKRINMTELGHKAMGTVFVMVEVNETGHTDNIF